MIHINDVAEAKKNFMKEFKDVNMFSIIIDNDNDSKDITITFRGFSDINSIREYTIFGSDDAIINKKNICISFAHKEDTFLDIIFDKNGFYYEAYKNAYNGMTMISDMGSNCYMSSVIFHNAKGNKRAEKMELCNASCNMVR